MKFDKVIYICVNIKKTHLLINQENNPLTW